jgi:hypothetical protein
VTAKLGCSWHNWLAAPQPTHLLGSLAPDLLQRCLDCPGGHREKDLQEKSRRRVKTAEGQQNDGSAGST